MLYKIQKTIIRLLTKLLFGLEISGKENIPEKGGFILACNHRSFLDPPVVGACCYRDSLNYMAKAELFESRLFGAWLRSVHVFPVKRGEGDLFSLREAIRRIKHGQGLLIFPEGTRQERGKFGPAEAGIGFIALKTGACVVPALISGSDLAWPNDRKFPRFFNKISVKFGNKICFENKASYQDVADSIMGEIKRLAQVQ